MAEISLEALTDDILLLVRNNNISESEDISRAQIYSWIKAHKHNIWKEEKDKRKALAIQNRISWDELIDDEYIQQIETGPMKLVDVVSESGNELYTKVTEDALEGVLNNDQIGILAVYDENGENIQYMNKIRRNYHYWRKYTFGDMTAYYDDGHIYVQGLVDKGRLQYIYVSWLKEVDDDEDDNDKDAESITIPAWMVPLIKQRIIANELAFMLNRPSDDSNNATLSSVKPHGPQDNEK